MTIDLTALLGSRICHDLISPLGAIGNGVELLTLSGAAVGPEITLISESVANANARIRFFRVAFGAASGGQSIARSDLRGILDDITRGGRLTIDWQAAGDPDRSTAKLMFLLIQCLETALAYGGRITVTLDHGVWSASASASKLKIDAALWSSFRSVGARPFAPPPPGWDTLITPALVHFALVPHVLTRLDHTLAIDIGEVEITLRF
jgi:histidine phosphotransferase ChpT